MTNKLDIKDRPILNGSNAFSKDPSISEVNKPYSILFIATYPPRECGIATYSQDLINVLKRKFGSSFKFHICALESENEKFIYSNDVAYILDIDDPNAFISLAKFVESSIDIDCVIVQHEFGLFHTKELAFNQFLTAVSKPIITVFHTVLPKPNRAQIEDVQHLSSSSDAIIVMTKKSSEILAEVYTIPKELITVIQHGTHLVAQNDKIALKELHHFAGRTILSTFGLLSEGKSIETTLNALVKIIKHYPDVLFLIIGKTHPTVLKQQGESYRIMLQQKVKDLNIDRHVHFINSFVPLPQLLSYLQLTDIYLFTSKDPAQAVSGTLSYAVSCGCPVIATSIPHAIEVLSSHSELLIDFENDDQLAEAVIRLLSDDKLRNDISLNGLHKMASTSWENSAIAHAELLTKIASSSNSLNYVAPPINLAHLKRMTTDFGMIQFSKINHPDRDSGYTLDDNARAMIAMCQLYGFRSDASILTYIELYLNFISFCLQSDGNFLNYVNEHKQFTAQNYSTDLSDANGRALWSLGYLTSIKSLPEALVTKAELIMESAILNIKKRTSPRSIAFTIKGLYYLYMNAPSSETVALIRLLADRLLLLYGHESEQEWLWFEPYLTYANSVLPEAMLLAWSATGDERYKVVAKEAFDFLLLKTFGKNGMEVIPTISWYHKGGDKEQNIVGAEQPIDVAYTILALGNFYEVFSKEEYLTKMKIAFDWFLGKNYLKQIIYNPVTGGCYDGLERDYVNLNQGAESTVSYLLARIQVGNYFGEEHTYT